MNGITIERTVDAPAAKVWTILTDLEHAPDIISGINKVEHLSGPAFGMGTTWHETRTMMGREATEDMTIVELDDGHHYVAAAESHGTAYRSSMIVEPIDETHSVVKMTFDAEPRSAMAKVLGATVGRLFTGATKKMIESDLDDIARAAESR